MTGYAPPFDGIKTLHDLWESTCSRHSDEECLGTRDVAPDVRALKVEHRQADEGSESSYVACPT